MLGTLELPAPRFQAELRTGRSEEVIVLGVGRSQVKIASPLSALAVALARQGRPSEAWRRREAGLARGLLVDLAALTLRPLTAAQRERETEMLVLLSALDEQIGKLAGRLRRTPDDDRLLEQLRRDRDTQDGNYMEFEHSLEAAYGEFAGRPASLEHVQASLTGDAALLGWINLGDASSATAHLWGCLVRHEGEPVWVKIPGTGPNRAWVSADDRRAEELRAALVSRDAGWRPLARAVAAQRLGPLWADLEGIRRLVVLPSATMFERLARSRSKASAPPKLLALGDPAYPIDAPAPSPPPSFGLAVQSVELNSNAGRGRATRITWPRSFWWVTRAEFSRDPRRTPGL